MGFLLKSEEEDYLYCHLSSDLVHIDELRALHDVLRVISTKENPGLKITSVDPLPEIGGPNVVADRCVPTGWDKNIEREVREDSSGKAFYEHGVYALVVLLFWDGRLEGTTQHLIEAEANNCYIWQPSCNEIYRIDKRKGCWMFLII